MEHMESGMEPIIVRAGAGHKADACSIRDSR